MVKETSSIPLAEAVGKVNKLLVKGEQQKIAATIIIEI
jgi:hypothetical protein